MSSFIPRKQKNDWTLEGFYKNAVPLNFEVYNQKRKSKHSMGAAIPMDSLDMDLGSFEKAYGSQIVKSVFDLIQHPSFRLGLEKPKLIIQDEGKSMEG